MPNFDCLQPEPADHVSLFATELVGKIFPGSIVEEKTKRHVAYTIDEMLKPYAEQLDLLFGAIDACIRDGDFRDQPKDSVRIMREHHDSLKAQRNATKG